MPSEISRVELLRLVAEGAQLLEVLPKDEYEDEHLPGALSFPLRQIEESAREELDVARPIITYCWDSA